MNEGHGNDPSLAGIAAVEALAGTETAETSSDDNAVAAELEGIDRLFWDCTRPEDAVNDGYLHYLSLTLPQGDPLRQAAAKVVEDLQRFFGQFETNRRAWRYLSLFKAAAISYARGLMRANAIFEEARASAIDRKEVARKTNILTATRQGMFRGALRLSLAAVTTFATAMALFKFRLAVEGFGQPGASPGWTSLAVAGFITLATIWFELGKVNKWSDKILLDYELAILHARWHRMVKHEMELQIALSMAEDGYRRILKREPPDGTHARVRLLASVREQRDDYAREWKRLMRERPKSLLSKIWSRRGRRRNDASLAEPLPERHDALL